MPCRCPVDEPDEFKRSGRKVVLLTYQEAQAIHETLRNIVAFEGTDLARAKRVLRYQLHWLQQHPEATGEASASG